MIFSLANLNAPGEVWTVRGRDDHGAALDALLYHDGLYQVPGYGWLRLWDLIEAGEARWHWNALAVVVGQA